MRILNLRHVRKLPFFDVSPICPFSIIRKINVNVFHGFAYFGKLFDFSVEKLWDIYKLCLFSCQQIVPQFPELQIALQGSRKFGCTGYAPKTVQYTTCRRSREPAPGQPNVCPRISWMRDPGTAPATYIWSAGSVFARYVPDPENRSRSSPCVVSYLFLPKSNRQFGVDMDFGLSQGKVSVCESAISNNT